MAALDGLVDQAIASELFTSPRIEADLARFLREQSPALKALAARAADGEFDRVYFAGGGGSFANMLSGQWLMDRFGGPPAQAFPSYELTWRDPAALGPRSLVFLAS
jgi:fructoselysine-6-P-deglycase FrlB-like protein